MALRSPRDLSRTWLALSESADPTLALPLLRETYFTLCASAGERALTPEDIESFDLIERDVARTFGGSGRFNTHAARDSLRRVLACYATFDREVGYVQSQNFLAGFMVRAGRGGGGGPHVCSW